MLIQSRNMDPVIVIESSDDEDATTASPHASTAQDCVIPRGVDVESIFLNFHDLCRALIKENAEGTKILKYLKARHQNASQTYKLSRAYRKLLQTSIEKLNEGNEDIYVHIFNIVGEIDRNCKVGKRKSVESTHDDEDPKEQKKQKFSMETTDAHVSSTETGIKNDDVPCTSGDIEPSPRKKHSAGKVKKYERYLAKLSKEIIRLQTQELSLEDLDNEESTYIQESKLKHRFMKVYKEICKLNGSRPTTGRIMEKTIRVTASRFPEINRKVELYVNNPKRESCLPNFHDVRKLVEKASSKANLKLSEKDLTNISKEIFVQVGEKMQTRRHKDFVFEFGCSSIDDIECDPDPASSDQSLLEALNKNRCIAKNSLDSVAKKYLLLEKACSQESLEDVGSVEEKEEVDTDETGSINSPSCPISDDFSNNSVKEADSTQIIVE